jgi:hypothetical protein
MTILDDLFKDAKDLWTAIQETADSNQQVKVDAAMALIGASNLQERILPQPFVKPSDTLIYNSRTPLNTTRFVGSELTILAPGRLVTGGEGADATVVGSPDYGIKLANARPPTSTAATDDATGKFVYFPLGHKL